MIKKPKLTDEELSRVLGEADIGRLDHARFGPRLSVGKCGCVAGVAMNILGSAEPFPYSLRAVAISAATTPPMGINFVFVNEWSYPAADAEGMLRYLEAKGVA